MTVEAPALSRVLGSTTPRIYTPPLVTGPPGPCGCGCALTPATSWGFSVSDFAVDPIGVELLPWQRWAMIHTLELLPTGRPRYRTILLLVGRQNGKTTVVEVKNLWKMYVLQVALIIGTAQNLDIAEESWDKAVEICEAVPELAAEIKQIDKTNGKKALKLVNGSRWKIAAASRRGGRGLSGDDVNLDELREHQTWAAWGAVTKTTMARPDAQVFAFSNAGDDRSVVLNSLVKKGRAAAADPANADPTMGHFEWSVPDDVKCTCQRTGGGLHSDDCRLADRRLWAMANPALGYTISEASLRSALNTDPEEIFRTECLCQRVPMMTPDWAVIGEAEWTRIGAAAPPREAMLPIAIALDVTPERSHTSIAVVGEVDGLTYAEITEHRRGTRWAIPWVVDRVKQWSPVRIVISKNSPAGSLIKGLETALAAEGLDVEVTTPSASDEAQACGAFVDAASPPPESGSEPTLRHLNQQVLDDAVRGAVQASLGDGAWRWSRKNSLVVISPLVAATLALWGYETRPRNTSRPPATAPVPPPSSASDRELFRPSGRLQL